MDTFLLLLLLVFTASGILFILYRMNKTINELKKGSPTGAISQDEAFAAFTDLLIEMIPEFVAGYKEILSQEKDDETKVKVVVDTIVNDVLEFIEIERHGDAKLESIYKLTQLIPRDILIKSITTSVMTFINKYFTDEEEREEKIVEVLADVTE